MTRTLPRRPLAKALGIGTLLLALLIAPATGIAPVRAADPPVGSPAGSPDAAPAVPSAADAGVVPVVPGATSPAPAPRPTLVWHGPRAGRVVALTFDDGWSAVTLRRIYRVLVREHVPATFFVTGIYIQRAPALWRRIAAAGFPLAGHSYRHRDTRSLTPREVARDFARTRAAIEGATGRPMLPLFRPPYGARTAATDRMAAAAGFPVVVMWDATGGDAVRGASVGSVVRNATRGRSGAIVLLHAGPRVTPRALPRIIARYRARGFTFVTVPDLLRLPPEMRVVRVPAVVTQPHAAPPVRAMDRADDPAPVRRPASSAVALLGPVAGPGPATGPDTPVAPPPVLAEAPPARDAAWARRAGTPTELAGFTAGALVLLVAVAALRGRRRRIDDEAGASGATPAAPWDAPPA